MGVIFAISVVCIVIGCMSSLLVPMKGAEISFRKQLLTPHLFAIAILSLIILIAWIFGMVGTDYGVVGTASTATQYIFGFMLMIHAVILLILTLLRTEDTRNVWKNCLNKFTGKSGKYDFAAEEIPRQKSGDAEAIGLGTSGQFSREGSVKKKKLTGEDAVPLSVRIKIMAYKKIVLFCHFYRHLLMVKKVKLILFSPQKLRSRMCWKRKRGNARRKKK